MRDEKGRFLMGHRAIHNGKGEFEKYHIPWNKGVIGYKTQPCSKERKKKIAQALLGMKRSEETKKKISQVQLGKKLSEEHKKNIGKANKNRPVSLKTRLKISKKNKGKNIGQRHSPATEFKKGKNNRNWVGGTSENYRKKIAGRKWWSIARQVRKRDDYICQHCNKYPAYCVHHIIPWRLTHDDIESNLVTLCRNCHSRTNHQFLFQGKLFQ